MKSSIVVAAAFLSAASVAVAGVAGPVKVSADGRYFVDAPGQPFFWLGDTAWPLFTQYAPRRPRRTWRTARARASRSSRACWPGATARASKDEDPGPQLCRPRPWLDDDPAQPNAAYFQHVDRLLDLRRARLVLAMLPTWGYYVNDVQVFNADQRPRLRPLAGRALQGRAQHRLGQRRRPHPHRLRGGLPRAGPGPARGRRRGTPDHLSPLRLALLVAVLPRRGLAGFQHDRDLDRVGQGLPRRAGRRPAAPSKPVVLGEGAYENGPEYPQGPITPLIVRRQAWWAFMAGGFLTYGQDQMWRMGPGWDRPSTRPGAAHVAVQGHRHLAPLVGEDARPGALRQRRRLRAHAEHGGALRGREPHPRLPVEPHDRLPPLGQDRGEDGEGHLDQPGHRRAQGRGNPRNRQPHRRHLPRRPHPILRDPGHWEDAVLLLEAVEDQASKRP